MSEKAPDLRAVTRFEVIDQHGRVFVIYGLSNVSLLVQDDGRTLKLFCNSTRKHSGDGEGAGGNA